MRGDENIHVFKRTIDDQIVKRALTIMLISFAIALTGLFILSISEQADFIDLLFEDFFCFCDSRINSGSYTNTDICWKNCYNYFDVYRTYWSYYYGFDFCKKI